MDAVQVMAYLRKRSSACSIWWDSSVLDYTGSTQWHIWLRREFVYNALRAPSTHLCSIHSMMYLIRSNVSVCTCTCMPLVCHVAMASIIPQHQTLCGSHFFHLRHDMLPAFDLPIMIIVPPLFVALSSDIPESCSEGRVTKWHMWSHGEAESLIHWFKTGLDVYISS